MTEERIKIFLQYFYEQYVKKCYKGSDIVLTDGSDYNLTEFNVPEYLKTYLDIYIEHCDYELEYSKLYNSSLFHATRQSKPEEFNQLQIFLIENIQLFFHTILEAAVSKTLKEKKLKKIKLQFALIDNAEMKLLDLVKLAEEQMKAKQLMPPSEG